MFKTSNILIKKIIGYALAKTLKDYYFSNIMGMLTEQSDKYNI